MNWVILVLLGLVLGWFIELLIDYFFWRRRRICTDAEVNLQASLNEANAVNTDLRSQLDEVTEQASRVSVLESELQSKTRVLEETETRTVTLRTQVDDMTAQLRQLPRLESELQTATRALDEAEATIARLRSEVSDLDDERRRSRNLSDELEVKTRELTEAMVTGTTLRQQVSELTTQVRETASLTAELQAKTEALEAAETTVMTLQSQIDGLHDQDTTAIEAELQAKIDALNASESMVATLRAQIETLTEHVERLPRLEAELRSKETTLTGMVGRLRERETELDRLRDQGSQMSALETMLQQQGNEIMRLTTELASLARLAVPSPLPAPDGSVSNQSLAYASAPAQSPPQQNLQRISGISTRIQRLLYSKGIRNYAQLAAAQQLQLDDVLDQAAANSTLSKAELYQTWIEQAQLIAAGNQPQLKWVQDQIRKRTQRDNLQRIWGIGPKTANMLRSHGIDTFEQLAALDVGRLEAMVKVSQTPNGPPGSVLYAAWTKLAGLAATCDWDEFEAEENRLQATHGAFQDDLQQIRGIGPELDRRLRAQGIQSFAQLSQLDATRLDDILQSTGVNTGSLGQQIHPSWRQQVALAADGDWDALEALQFQLGWWDKLESLSP